MYQPIEEEIQVAGVYSEGKFIPKKFQWRNRAYSVEEITFSAASRDGEIKLQHFSVSSGGNLYRLIFNRDSQHWKLAEIWCE